MYYQATIGYETDVLDRQGNPRIRKVKYIVDAESVEEVSLVLAKYRAEDNRDSEVLNVAKFSIDCVIDKANTPQYYQ